MPIALAVLGASGKMGKRILHLAENDPDFSIVTAMAMCNVAIDFTAPEATLSHLEAAMSAKKAIVIGTTGHSTNENRAIVEAAQTIPILFSPNFSFGIALCLEAVALLGKRLFGRCTINILETHHEGKKDRPSGTALALADAVGSGKAVLESSQPRTNEEIVIHSIRAGEVVGEHTVLFETGHERIELKHTVHSRDAFAKGALMGAKFLAKQPPGLYALKDLFNEGIAKLPAPAKSPF
jgi:4-hydroxy-tetrahydrodipicolinate reductase